MGKQYPWEYHPDLTAERLGVIAQLIRQGRNDALDRHNEDIGDDAWLLGCSAYQFGRFRILNAMDGGEYLWLNVIDRSLQFIFQVGQIPVRFYKGEADDPNERTRRRTYAEFDQLALLFGQDDDANLLYRFAVETDFDGAISAIKFVGLRGEVPAFCWEVPNDNLGISVLPITELPSEGVELPAPVVRLPQDDQEREGGAA